MLFILMQSWTIHTISFFLTTAKKEFNSAFFFIYFLNVRGYLYFDAAEPEYKYTCLRSGALYSKLEYFCYVVNSIFSRFFAFNGRKHLKEKKDDWKKKKEYNNNN